LAKTGLDRMSLPRALEDAGAAGILMSNWSQGFGVNKIFSAYTKKAPTLDLSLEDYGMLFRMAENGDKPTIRVTAESKNWAKYLPLILLLKLKERKSLMSILFSPLTLILGTAAQVLPTTLQEPLL